jgi:2-polyprenyl-6-methoxyphenol hydroxylase-like FAD-dependent oxidoreductase
MSNIEQTEVLVTGAGPVGMLTALLLKQDGINTQVIDQESRTAGHSYSCALHPRSIELLHQAGLAYEAIKAGHRVNTVAFYDGSVRRAEVRLSELPTEFPFALVLQQSTLENLLEQKLRQADVKIHWSHRLSGLEMDDRGATATIERLGTTGKGYSVPDFEAVVEKSLPARAHFIVGADGSNSLVRHRLGIPFERAGDPQHFAVYEIEAGGLCDHEGRVVLEDARANVLWPLSDTRCRWSFQVNPDKVGDDFPQKQRDRLQMVESPSEQDNLHHLRRLLHDRAPWFQNPVREVTWSTDVQFEPRLARHFGRDFCWLAGDAAHQTGPVGMQSMNIGFREAADLARVLRQILRKSGPMDLLKGYDRAHRCVWQQLLGFKAATPATDAAAEWVQQRAARIVGSIPASGAELTCLLKQLGIRF